MKKISIILPFVLLSLVGAGCWSGAEPQQPAAPTVQQPGSAGKTADQAGPAGGKKTVTDTLKNLMARSESLSCTWKKLDDKQDIKGVVHIKGNKFKQEVKISGLTGQDDKEYTFNAVSDGEWFYTWNNLMPDSGTKFKLSELEAQGQTPDDGQGQATQADLEEKLDYECEPWTGNADFKPPSDVKFTDQTSSLKQLQQGAMQGAPADPCAACGMMPSAQLRDMCRQQNKCE